MTSTSRGRTLLEIPVVMSDARDRDALRFASGEQPYVRRWNVAFGLVGAVVAAHEVARMIAGMPDDRPLQFATTDLLTVPESNVLNAALALVRNRQATLGPFFDTFLATLTRTDPDLARLLRAAAVLDRDRKTDKVLREQHYRRTRPAKVSGPRSADPFLTDPVTRG